MLCALLCALPTFAQDQDKEAPKEFGFQFGYRYSDKTRVTSTTVGYQKLIRDGNPVVFDETVAGKKGFIEHETLSFLDNEGTVLGTLNSTFDESNHLRGQTLVEGTAAPRALNWFVTGAQSPVLTVKGSFLSARYTVKNGFLSERVLTLKLPAGTRAMKTVYDEMGRRERDITDRAASDPIKGAMTIQFFYDASGLVRFRTPSGPDGKTVEMTLERNDTGQIARMISKEDGILATRSTMLFGEQGKSGGLKIETFEDGILSTVATLDEDGKSSVTEEYDDGVLSSRKTQVIGEGGAVKLVSLEEFDAKGKLFQRTDYDQDGAVSSVTTYGEDGTIKSTRNFNIGD